MVTVKHSGSFKNLENLLDRIFHGDLMNLLDHYGQMGVRALQSATPKDTGATASSWSYEIKKGRTSSTITWTNSNAPNGVQVAVLLQYGHATGNGGYVQGIDYINPALKPIFDSIADSAWKDVTKA